MTIVAVVLCQAITNILPAASQLHDFFSMLSFTGAAMPCEIGEVIQAYMVCPTVVLFAVGHYNLLIKLYIQLRIYRNRETNL